MKTIISILAPLLLAACGVETASTAATAAALKKQEVEQGKKTMEQVNQKMDQLNQQLTQRQERNEEAGK